MRRNVALAPGLFTLTEALVRRDGTATYDFQVVAADGQLFELPEEERGPEPNRGTWIMLDLSPN
jgi:hypothetical protein